MYRKCKVLLTPNGEIEEEVPPLPQGGRNFRNSRGWCGIFRFIKRHTVAKS